MRVFFSEKVKDFPKKQEICILPGTKMVIYVSVVF